MNRRNTTPRLRGIVVLLLLMLGLAACGGNADNAAPAAASTPRIVPTMPAAQFTAVAQQAYTDTISSAAAEVQTTPTVSVDLTRGQTIYTNRCAECHGPVGEGVADKGGPATAWSVTSAEFDDAVRTGKSGELGTVHIFGPSAVSPSGLTALYAYVESLSQ